MAKQREYQLLVKRISDALTHTPDELARWLGICEQYLDAASQMTKDELWLIEYWLNNSLHTNSKVAEITKNDTLVKILNSYLVFDKKEINEASQKNISTVED